MKLALVGCGTVGKAFIELLGMKKEGLKIDLELCCVINSKGGIYNHIGFNCRELYQYLSSGGSLIEYPSCSVIESDISYIIEKTEIDTVVLTTPTNKENGEPGITYIRKLLNKGINVITADKDPILVAYHELRELADKNNARLLILTNVLMNTDKKLKDIKVEGVTALTVEDISSAKVEGKKYKLIGSSTRHEDGIHMTVRLERVDASSEFYFVDGKNKAVKYYTDTLGELTVIGGASGAIPAAASLLRDIINITQK